MMSGTTQRWGFSLLTWGILAFAVSLAGAYSFANPRIPDAPIVNAEIAILTPAFLAIAIALGFLGYAYRSVSRRDPRGLTPFWRLVPALFRIYWPSFKSDWPIMLGILFALSALYNLLFLTHWW